MINIFKSNQEVKTVKELLDEGNVDDKIAIRVNKGTSYYYIYVGTNGEIQVGLISYLSIYFKLVASFIDMWGTQVIAVEEKEGK